MDKQDEQAARRSLSRPPRRILVPLDGSARAERALPVAERLALATGGTIVLLRVVHPTYPTAYASMAAAPVSEPEVDEVGWTAEATEYLARMAERAGRAEVQTETMVRVGWAAQEILAVAPSVDQIVIASHGRTGPARWVLGSVADKVIRAAPVPVLVLHEGESLPLVPRAGIEGPMCVLVPLDGSRLAEVALAPAAHLLSSLCAVDGGFMGQLHLLHVLGEIIVMEPSGADARLSADYTRMVRHETEEYLRGMAERVRSTWLDDPRFSITWSVVSTDDTATAIIEAAEGRSARSASPTSTTPSSAQAVPAENPAAIPAERGAPAMTPTPSAQSALTPRDAAPAQTHANDELRTIVGADVIVMATHGRSGLEHWVIGSITERVLHGTKLPLLTVRPTSLPS